jgi:hypothetical protein
MSTPSPDLLLRQVLWGTVEPVRYSRPTAFGRVEPALRATALALVAVLSGIMLGSLRPAV